MKNVVLAVALAVSGVVTGQEIPQTLDSLYTNIVDSILLDSKLKVKDGDYDAPECIGLLQHIFSDDFTKYEYEKINPRIGQLIVHSSDLENDITFSEFSEIFLGRSNYIKYFDTTNYTINYGTLPGERTLQEYISIVNNNTGIYEFQFIIIYDKLSNLQSNEYLNLGSLHAIFIKD